MLSWNLVWQIECCKYCWCCLWLNFSDRIQIITPTPPNTLPPPPNMVLFSSCKILWYYQGEVWLNCFESVYVIGIYRYMYIHASPSKFIMENFSRFICTEVPLSKNKNQSIMTEKRYERRTLLLWYCVVYAEDRRNNNWWHKWTRTALFYLMAEWIIFFLSSYIAIIPVDIQLQSLTCKFLSIICLQAEAQTVTTY